MKPFREEDLIAYHLHELSPRRARALERALQTDPSLAAEFNAYATTLRSFKDETPFDVDEEVIERNWKALWPSLPAYRAHPIAGSRWRMAVLAGSALAFAATTFFIAMHLHKTTIPTQVSSMRQPDDAARSTSSTEEALTAITPTFAPPTEEGGPIRRQGRPERPLFRSHSSGLREDQPRKSASLPLAAEPPSVLHFIPLAPVNSLTLPIPSSPATSVASLPLMNGQETPSQSSSPHSRSKTRHERLHFHHEIPTDLTFAMGGTLIGTHEVSSGDVTRSQGATHAVSANGSFHQQFRPALGYRIAVSYTRPDFAYNSKTSTTSGSGTDINGHIYELAATYVVQGPHPGNLSTSVEAGGGLMAILPTTQSVDTSYNLRGAGVIGVAADYSLTKHLGLHAAYRAQVFKGPDFNYSGVTAPVFTTTLLSNEPTLGITYRFSHK